MSTVGIRLPEEQKMARLEQQAAHYLDAKIRDTGRNLAANIDALLNLLEQAKAGQIHKALGFPSWPAYVCDAVQIAPSHRTDRKLLAALMSAEGLSQRAVAAVLSVDQKTVSNDLRSGEENSSLVTVGLDGKGYERDSKKPPKAAKPWFHCARAKLDKLMDEAGESDERHDDLVALFRAALHTLGVDVVVAAS
jgi:hypothetical protein